MTSHVPFRRRTLATLVAAACGTTPTFALALSQAGKVDFAIGDVTATGSAGERRAISKGAAIHPGDTIETNAGRAWLRFKDGGYMSLQPGTEFRVDEYQFDNGEDGSERSFFSLLKGGVRAVTGLIGKTNRRSYRVSTPVATIGIRGTEYLAQLGNSLTLSCGEGICVVTNEAGEVELLAGQTIYIKDQKSRGERVTRKVVLPPNAPVVFAGGEFRNEDGSLATLEEVDVTPEPPEVPVPPVVPGPGPDPEPEVPGDVPLVEGQQSGLFLALSYGGEAGDLNPEFDARVESGVATEYVTATLSGENFELQEAGWNRDPETDMFDDEIRFTGIESGATTADTDTDGIIAWGRWTGGYATGTVFDTGNLYFDDGNESVHYLVGAPTPEADLANLKSLGEVAVYNLIGATTPTFGQDFGSGPGSFGAFQKISGALSADFANSTVATSLLLDYANRDISIDSGPMPIAAGAGGTFGGSGSWASSFSASYDTKIEGFFSGAGASRAGYAYDVHVDDDGVYSINGVAAFSKSGAIVAE